MKYEEYQVWYHTYNTAIQAILPSNRMSTDVVIDQAKAIADIVVEEFKQVEDKPQAPNIDMQGFMNSLVNTAKSGKR